MLPELTQFEDNITLVSNTGIQFIDFGFKLDLKEERQVGEFAKASAETVTRLAYNKESDFYYYDKTPEVIPNNIVKMTPEYAVSLDASLKLLNGKWLPLPFVKFNAPFHYEQGPSNWARMRVVKLSSPDLDGNNYRITIAFDTNLMPENEHSSYLAPSKKDVSSGALFRLSIGVEQTRWFFMQEWVNDWLKEIFEHGSAHLDADELDAALTCREPQAHYLNVLSLIAPSTVHKSPVQPKLKVPTVKIVSSDINTSSPLIPVDLVLDVGNSRTCGILIENLGNDSSRLNSRYILQLRDLSEPEKVYNEPFDSRIEFSQANFGKENFSVKSGRKDSFLWPTMARVGAEAGRLAGQRSGTEGATGLSSPKRYLWDEKPYVHIWRFNSQDNDNGTEAQATAAPFAHLINEYGEALYTLDEDDRLPVFNPKYSRSSLMTFMLAEVLTQALCQMNSPAQRARQGQTSTPRYLNSITLTVPPGMAQAERAILRKRLAQAVALVWKSLDWHEGEESPFEAGKENNPLNPMPSVPLPKLNVEWDEASCGQLVYLFTEINEYFAGHPEQFFKTILRPDKKQDQSEEKIILGSIDIGGGTTDLVITEYRLDRAGGNGSGSNVHIVPRQLFRDGFRVAGDDIVLDLIRHFILPYFSKALVAAGVGQPETLMSVLCGNHQISKQDEICRQQLTLQVFVPIALGILKMYEQFGLDSQEEQFTFSFKELMGQASASKKVQDFVLNQLRINLSKSDLEFDLHQISIDIDLRKLHRMFLSGKMTLTESLSALCEVLAHYPCDMLLLTGRPSRLPGVQAFVRQNLPLHPGRILPMHKYRAGGWFPFHKNGMIDDPKTTAVVGAMLCMLSNPPSITGFFFRVIDLKPYSTVRYFGVIDQGNHIAQGDVLYSDIKTVDQQMELPQDEQGNTPQLVFRGNLRLGFRQLPVARWPASPLYTLRFTESGKLKNSRAMQAGGTEIPVIRLNFRVKEERDAKNQGIPSDALMIDNVESSTVNVNFNQHDFELELNTMLDTGMSETNYWLDSGNVI